MGTIAEVQVAHADERVAEDAIDAALAELRWVERTMTRFTADSDIGRANLGAGREGVAISPETALVVAARAALGVGQRWPLRSGARRGVGAVGRAPSPRAAAERAVQRLASRGFWRKVDLDRAGEGRGRSASTIRDIRLDLGGIAKGYGIDRAMTALRAKGIAHAIVTVGGDLYALGQAPDGAPWKVGIRDPHDLDRLAGEARRRRPRRHDVRRLRAVLHLARRPVSPPDGPGTAAPRRTPMHSVTVLGDNA